MSRACSKNEKKRNSYGIVVERLDGKGPLGRPTRCQVDNIKIDLSDIVGVVWIGQIWFRIGASGELL
jgi:hypothetical protein